MPELRFVATAAFKLRLNTDPASTERTKFTLADLEDSVSQQIAEKLQEEFNLTDPHPLLPNITFEKTALSLEDHARHTKGTLTDFLENLYPGAPIPAAAAYQAISGEIARLTSCEEPFNVLSEMIAKKGLSRSKFERILSQLPIIRDPASIWQAAQARIAQEAGFPIEAAIRRAWKQYEADRMDFSNQLLQETRSRVKAEMLAQTLLSSNPTLLAAANSAILNDLTTLSQPLEYMQAMAILEYYESQISPTSSQP